MKVVPYDKKYKEDFIEMNKQWISKMFVIEEEDLSVLNNIECTLDADGQIFFALGDEEKVLACCMIAPLPNGEWEIEKFCAKGMYTGTGAGSACLKALNRHPAATARPPGLCHAVSSVMRPMNALQMDETAYHYIIFRAVISLPPH